MQGIVEAILVPLSILSVGNIGLKLCGKSVLPVHDRIQSFVISLALGLSILSVTAYTLNIAQVDLRPFFWGFYYSGITFGVLRFGHFMWRHRFRFQIGSVDKEARISVAACLGVIVLATVFLILLSAVNQRNDWDAVQLYLPMGKILFEKGLLPTHSQEIGRDIVNFFLGAYAYGYGMTISESFLFPTSLVGIVSINLLGLVAATYAISSRILQDLSDRLLAGAFVLTLPVMAYYFASVPHYVDVPSVFLAFALILCVFNRLNTNLHKTSTLVATNLVMGMIAFTTIGFKLQNLLVLAPLTVLLVGSLRSRRQKLLALGTLTFAFAISVFWALTYGTVLAGLSLEGNLFPVFVIISESSILLLFFGILSIRDKSPTITGLRSFLPGIIGGYAVWFLRPTLVESTPFFPASLPNSPQYVFARNIYSSITSSLFKSALSQYGLAAPYLGSYVSPLLLPLLIIGGYSLLRRNQFFMLKWILLLNAASILLTGYVDIRYVLWVAPLSGLLGGESASFLTKKLRGSRGTISLVPLLFMSLGLGIDSNTPTVYHHILPLFTISIVASSVYVSTFLWNLVEGFAHRIRICLPDFRPKLIGTLLLSALCISLFGLTYGNLFIYDRSRETEAQYEEVYTFLRDHVPQGSTVLSIGFPALYYKMGLNAIPMDDPEGLAQLYPYSRESNSTLAVMRLSSEMGVNSIIVPTIQNGFWYGYFENLKGRLPLISVLTSGPLSHNAFLGSGYQVYLIN